MSCPAEWMFWIAEYPDGTNISQYDKDGIEHEFSALDQDKIVKFGWYAITEELAMIDKTKFLSLPFISAVRLVLREGQKLFACRENKIKTSLNTLETNSHEIVCYKLGIVGEYVMRIYPTGVIEVSCA